MKTTCSLPIPRRLAKPAAHNRVGLYHGLLLSSEKATNEHTSLVVDLSGDCYKHSLIISLKCNDRAPSMPPRSRNYELERALVRIASREKVA